MERRLYFAATLSAACMTVTPAIAAEATDALVAKGAYVETAADCQPCHTAVGGKPFAGGLALGTHSAIW
ncbi:MAG: hypothetical protein P8Y82_05115 [Methyloceanibacter sp.]